MSLQVNNSGKVRRGSKVLETRKWKWFGFERPGTDYSAEPGSEGVIGSGTREFCWGMGCPRRRSRMGWATGCLRRAGRPSEISRPGLGTARASPEVSFLFGLLSFPEGPTGLPD